ncbi:MAG: hypothetical protein A2603_14490 [Bdellovibrionales bacterium RIFOXYD1_FULL_55_31]|nr:MAG: hypothetical protein A2603_14490 [Bdellovibrionales bacterium RIFOXYD1_FULL_55_31]
MKIKALTRHTDLFFSEFSGKIIDRGNYVVVQTPDNPSFHWGNYIIFSAPPGKGDYDKWCATYRAEFPYYSTIRHMTFTWNEDDSCTPDFEPFLKAGFELDKTKVLATNRVVPPPKINQHIQVRPISTDSEWEAAIQLQILCRKPEFDQTGYEAFKRRQFETYRKMANANRGHWFGAFINDKLVGDLGIFHDGTLGRYQNVGTHPDYRRQGICGTLVYETARIAFKDFNVQTLVMEADADYHAGAIYESVGFKVLEYDRSLSWWVPHD